ncbi:hypothetical protein [Hirschia baltica]|uniref:Uncharacterized protein n=1 Tax=Hirschia baltica (strain ATCC 49814 / DSM 5838 / IFAM 1418) TaxID=582402 RepID=C6XJN0_HIRBI|nr:hypothetical protein [Hirschia baltica]ACT59325.1 hypothetical protein Hbal_1637 [Hirschia baltica ATCC 49814]
MSESLAAIVGKLGPELMADYCRIKLKQEPPDIQISHPQRAFGLELTTAWQETFPAKKLNTFYSDMQRINRMSERKCIDAIIGASKNPSQLKTQLYDLSSAPKRALFCYLHYKSEFQTGEFRVLNDTYRYSERYSDQFEYSKVPAYSRIHANEVFEAQVKSILARAIGIKTDIRIERRVVTPRFPQNAQSLLEFMVCYGNPNICIPIFTRNGPEFGSINTEETFSILIDREHKTVSIYGKYLKRDGRQALADALNDHLIRANKPPQKLAGPRFMPRLLVTSTPLPIPPRFGIARIGTTNVVYKAIDSINTASHRLTPEKPALVSYYEDNGKTNDSLSKLKSADIQCVELEILMERCDDYPHGRKLNVSLKKNSLNIANATEEDRFIVAYVIESLGVCITGMPLFDAA